MTGPDVRRDAGRLPSRGAVDEWDASSRGVLDASDTLDDGPDRGSLDTGVVAGTKGRKQIGSAQRPPSNAGESLDQLLAEENRTFDRIRERGRRRRRKS